MRAISTQGLARSQADRQRVAWTLEVWSQAWTWRGASRALEIEGVVYEAMIQSVDRWQEVQTGSFTPGGRAQSQAQVTLTDHGLGTSSLRAKLELLKPTQAQARLRMLWLDESGRPTLPEGCVLIHGIVSGWQARPAQLSVQIRDQLQLCEGKKIGRRLTQAMIPGEVSSAIGEPMPWVVGHISSSELMPLISGQTTRLAQWAAADATVMVVESLDGFPASGAFQIGGEMVGYTAVDTVNKTLGTEQAPLQRGLAATSYSSGEQVRHKTELGFVWLAADHPCKLISNVYVNGAGLPPTHYVSTTRQIGGRTVQIIYMAVWPTTDSGHMASTITADIQGLADGQGTLIENPADVLWWLLSDEQLAGLDEDRLDADSFEAVRAHLETAGYKFARRLTGKQTVGELIDQACREAGVWLGAGDPIRLRRTQAWPRPQDAVTSLDERRLTQASRKLETQAPGQPAMPDAIELMGAATTSGSRPSLLYPADTDGVGPMPQSYSLNWLDLFESGAQDLASLYWDHLRHAPLELAQTLGPGGALLEAGQTVAVQDAGVGLCSTPLWVREVSLDKNARVQLQLRGVAEQGYLWRYDDDHFIARDATGETIEIVIAGQKAARLDSAGNLSLAGTLKEGASLSGPYSQAIVWDGVWLNLCTGRDGVFVPFARLNAAGTMELAGQLLEYSDQAMQTGGLALGWNLARWWLTAQPLQGALEYCTDSQTLHLKNKLTENISL